MAEEKEPTDLVGAGIQKAEKAIGLVEKMGCCCLNLGCMFLVIASLSLVAMLVNAIESPMEFFSAVLGDIWNALVGS